MAPPPGDNPDPAPGIPQPGEDPGVPPDEDPAEQPDPESNEVAAWSPDDPESV